MPQGIIKPTKVDQAWIAADPLAALVGYASTILAVFGVFKMIGLDADQVAILGGAVLGVMGSVRALRERRRRQQVLELHAQHVALEEENAELKKKTGSLTDGEMLAQAPEGAERPQEGPEGP